MIIPSGLLSMSLTTFPSNFLLFVFSLRGCLLCDGLIFLFHVFSLLCQFTFQLFSCLTISYVTFQLLENGQAVESKFGDESHADPAEDWSKFHVKPVSVYRRYKQIPSRVEEYPDLGLPSPCSPEAEEKLQSYVRWHSLFLPSNQIRFWLRKPHSPSWRSLAEHVSCSPSELGLGHHPSNLRPNKVPFDPKHGPHMLFSGRPCRRHNYEASPLNTFPSFLSLSFLPLVHLLCFRSSRSCVQLAVI